MIANNRARKVEGALDRPRRRAIRCTCASSRTSTPRRASWSTRSSGSWTRAARATRSPSSTARTRRAACSRTCSCATSVAYQVIGGTQLLRPRRDQGRAGLPDAARQPVGHGGLPARGQLAAARDRRTPRRRAWSGYANTLGEPVWDVAAAPESGARSRRGRGQGGGPLHVGHGAAARARSRPAPAWATCCARRSQETGYLEALQAERTIEAQGRLENLEELVGVAREYDATAEEPSVEEFLQQIALFSEQDNLRDDEGIVTLMTLHNAKGLEFPVVFIIGMRGRRVPAHALDRVGRPRGGAAARLRRHHARQARALPDLRAHAQRSSAAATGTCRSRFIDEIPAELTDREEQALARAARPPPRGVAAHGAEAAPRAAGPGALVLRSATTWCTRNFGDGVVIGARAGRRWWWCASPPTARSEADGGLRAAEEATEPESSTARRWPPRCASAWRRRRRGRWSPEARGSAGRALATVLVGDDPASHVYVRNEAQGLGGGRHRVRSTTSCARTRARGRARRADRAR